MSAEEKIDPRRNLVAGDRAVLVQLPDLDATLGLHGRLRDLQAGADAVAGILELVPAASTVLVRFDPAVISRESLLLRLDAVSSDPITRKPGALVEILVVYDGDDLEEVATLLGITTEEVVRRHTGRDYTMAFAGFAPGFGYLIGGDPVLDVPRRASPRVRIPAGSVGLAGTYSGVYPRESPGGWQLIGTTALPMWDADRESPAAVRPGDRVRFVSVDEYAVSDPDPNAASVAARTAGPSADRPALMIESPGLRTLFQDRGREGFAALGVSASGTLDGPAMRLANRLVGNPVDTAVLEILFGRFRAAARGASVVAVTGAPVPVTVIRGETEMTIRDQRAIGLEDGDILVLGAPRSGLRTMLAVRGGFEVAPVLGSLSTDTLAELGPAPVSRGDVLVVRAVTYSDAVAEPVAWQQLPQHEVVLPIDLGPREDWFDTASIELLTGQAWTVTTQADRVGIRLQGVQPLVRGRQDELPSECAVTGSIQVPPNGQPILFPADHPLTGGYPIIGVVRHRALSRLAQLAPGMTVRFAIAD